MGSTLLLIERNAIDPLYLWVINYHYVMKLEYDLLLIVILCVEVGSTRWLTPTNLSPRSMRISTLFRWLINFCNKYVSSFSLMLSPWIIRTLTLPPLLASQYRATFARALHPPYTLPQNSHHTYLLWHFHSHSEIYCHATFTVLSIMTHTIITILFSYA